MGETLTYRSAFSRGLAVVTVSLAAALLVWLAVTEPSATPRYVGPVGLVAALAWLGFWRPAVEVSDGGVELHNVWRTVHVPWPALQDVDSRLGLRLVTAYGSYQAWAVPAPRRVRGGGPVAPSQAATWVVERWDQLKAAGHLDQPRLERQQARTELHTGALALCGAFLVLSVVGAIAT